jgi:hypothetical protein
MNPGWKVACAAAALVTLVGCEKARLDDEVRRLCAIDGGVKVYEAVKMPPEKFDKYGVVSIPWKFNAKPDDEYYLEEETRYYRKGNPEMWRSHYRVIRRADGKVLGESVSYTRRGGDLPSPMHDSYFSCPETTTGQLGLERSVFHVQGG